jgi:hypothetical protein
MQIWPTYSFVTLIIVQVDLTMFATSEGNYDVPLVRVDAIMFGNPYEALVHNVDTCFSNQLQLTSPVFTAGTTEGYLPYLTLPLRP